MLTATWKDRNNELELLKLTLVGFLPVTDFVTTYNWPVIASINMNQVNDSYIWHVRCEMKFNLTFNTQIVFFYQKGYNIRIYDRNALSLYHINQIYSTLLTYKYLSKFSKKHSGDDDIKDEL